MSEHIPGALARAVRDRAGNICEYCHLPQLLQEAAFHIDHIPRAQARDLPMQIISHLHVLRAH